MFWCLCGALSSFAVVLWLMPLLVAWPPGQLAEQVDAARLFEDVARFQSVAGQTRVTGSAGLAEARRALVERLGALGLEPEIEGFVVRHTFGRRAVFAANVVVTIGREGPPLYLVAHLDSKAAHDRDDAAKVGWRFERDPAPGADDDASGVAALLEVARILRGRMRRRIVLAWVDAEEMSIMRDDGFMTNLGSEPLAASAPPDAQAIAVDMLLRPRPWGPSLRLYSDGRLASEELVSALVHAAWVVAPEVELRSRIAPGFTWSDHGSFWAEGLGAVLMIEDDFDHARYHRVSDRLTRDDTFYSMEQLEAATRVLVAAVVLLGG